MKDWRQDLAAVMDPDHFRDMLRSDRYINALTLGIQAGLSEGDTSCIFAYTLGEPFYGESVFRATNWSLRNPGTALAAAAIPYARRLEAAIARLPAFAGIVHRRATLPNSVLQDARNGEFADLGFLSTSRRDDIFLSGRDYLIIQCEKGRDIATFSRYPDEQEVLFPPRTLFRVTLVEERSDGTTLVMEEA